MNLVYIFPLILSLIHCTNMKRWKLVEVSLMTFKKISFLMPVFCFDKFHMKISSKKVSLHFRLKIYQQLRSSSKQPMMSHTTEKNKLGSLELSRCKKWVLGMTDFRRASDDWFVDCCAVVPRGGYNYFQNMFVWTSAFSLWWSWYSQEKKEWNSHKKLGYIIWLSFDQYHLNVPLFGLRISTHVDRVKYPWTSSWTHHSKSTTDLKSINRVFREYENMLHENIYGRETHRTCIFDSGKLNYSQCTILVWIEFSESEDFNSCGWRVWDQRPTRLTILKSTNLWQRCQSECWYCFGGWIFHFCQCRSWHWAIAMSSSLQIYIRRKWEKPKTLKKYANHFFPARFSVLAGLWMGPLCGISCLKLPNANKRNKAIHSLVDCRHYYKVIISRVGIPMRKTLTHEFFFSFSG